MFRFFFKVLKNIRLPLISPSYLRHVIEALDVVKESPECLEFISEAKERLVIPYCSTGRPRRTTGRLPHACISCSNRKKGFSILP